MTDSLNGESPALLRMDFAIVELLGCYLFRNDATRTLALARASESLTLSDASIWVRIELLQVIFRVFARNNCSADARRIFDRYRILVGEVIANADPGNGSEIAKMFGVAEIIDEFGKLEARANGKGDPSGVPLKTSNH